MTAEERKFRDQILRYRNLHALNADAKVRADLEQMIQETRAKLDGLKEAPDQL